MGFPLNCNFNATSEDTITSCKYYMTDACPLLGYETSAENYNVLCVEEAETANKCAEAEKKCRLPWENSRIWKT